MHARLEAGLRGERIIGGKPAVMVLVMRVKLFGRDIVEVAPRGLEFDEDMRRRDGVAAVEAEHLSGGGCVRLGHGDSA